MRDRSIRDPAIALMRAAGIGAELMRQDLGAKAGDAPTLFRFAPSHTAAYLMRALEEDGMELRERRDVCDDRLIRFAMLDTAHRVPVTTEELAKGVLTRIGCDLNNRQAAGMAAQLHRVGWLGYSRVRQYDRPDGYVSKHAVTRTGIDILRLLYD